MIALCPILYVGWKLFKKTKIIRPENVDLQKDLDEIDEYQRNFVPTPSK